MFPTSPASSAGAPPKAKAKATPTSSVSDAVWRARARAVGSMHDTSTRFALQGALIHNPNVDKDVGKRTPPTQSLVGGAGSPIAGSPIADQAHTPKSKASVVDAGSVQKPPRRRSTEERLGGKIVTDSEADDDDDAAGDAADDDDDAAGDAAGDDDDLVDAAGLVALFENPDFQGGKITVSSAANSKLTFRWTPNGTVFATPPVSDAEADKYTVRPSPYPVENRSTNQKYVTFNVLATEANKTLVKNETQTWFRKR